MSGSTAIECRGLTRLYGRRTAVDALTLDVPRGVTFGLLGPNGAGKTTAIQLVLGLIRPSSGHARVLGGQIRDPGIRRRVGFVPERFQLPAYITAREYIEIHSDLSRLTRAGRASRVSECLELVGLADRAEDRLRGFSKGMQQRTMLAQALVADPELLVLDEPTSALDPLGRRMVREVIERAVARGATVVLNSHLLSEVELACDLVAVMYEGRVLHSGTIDELRSPVLGVTLEVGGLASEAILGAVGHLLHEVHVGTPDGSGVSTVRGTTDSRDDLPRIADAISAHGGRLYRLAHDAESLEAIFVRMVRGASDADGHTDTAERP